MDFQWLFTCAVVILAAMAIAVSLSYTIHMLTEDEYDQARSMNAKKISYKKCNMLSPRQRGKVIIAASTGSVNKPIAAFPFADYIDAKNTECEYRKAIDYGIAVGYADETGRVKTQISFVFATEDITNGEGQAITPAERTRRLDELGTMLMQLRREVPVLSDMSLQPMLISKEIRTMFA